MFFFGCEILDDCEIQWSSMKGYEWKIQFLKKSPNMSHFEKKHYQYCSGQSDECHGPKSMVACDDCWIFLDLNDASHLIL
jgi:hypothetical protein